MSKILVPVDFSDCSYILVNEALKVAKAEGASLLLLHALGGARAGDGALIQLGGGEPRSISDHLMRDAEAQMQRYAERLVEVESELRVVKGEPIAEILKAAQAPEITKVALITRGRKGLMKWLYGSITEAVKGQCSKPVIAIQTERMESCEARSCATCESGITEARYQIRAEEDG